MSKMEMIVNVHARFLHKHTGSPVHGPSFSARLYDKDILTDDFLDEATPDTDGHIHFAFDPHAMRDEDSIFEKNPDLYIVLLRDNTEIFHTPTVSEIDLENESNFSPQEGEWIDLGTFIIEV